MARPGFEQRFRDHIGSEEFDEIIQNFLKKNARRVLEDSNISEEKGEQGLAGEFTLDAHKIWKKYLSIIEDHMVQFQADEDLSDIQFKREVENVAERHPMLVRLMLASWEFEQFLEVCKEYVENNPDEEDGKVRMSYFNNVLQSYYPF